MFPLVILAQKNTAMTHNHTPIMQKLQEKFTKARQSGNPIEGVYNCPVLFILCWSDIYLSFRGPI